MAIPILSIVGKSDVGKTTLIEQLIPELKRRGLTVAVIKHHAHPTPIDAAGKDSTRLANAGADVVVVSSPLQVARFERVSRERTLDELASELRDVDLILTEGFKREARIRIEVSRAELGTELLSTPDELVAIVSDHPVEIGVPRFAFGDTARLADFIIRWLTVGRAVS